MKTTVEGELFVMLTTLGSAVNSVAVTTDRGAPTPANFTLSSSSWQNDSAAPRYIVPIFNDMSLVKTVVLSVMFVVSLVGNAATLLQMLRMRRRKSTINTLILHLATADLIVTFFCDVTDAVWASTVQWYAGDAMCKFVKFVQVFGLYLSTYIIVIISIDRCVAILDPMSRNKAPGRVRVMIIIAWVLSALFSLPQMFIFRVLRAPFDIEFYQCVTIGAYTAAWQEPLYSCLAAILTFVVPLVTMITAYMLIFCTINRKSKDFPAHETSSVTSDGVTRAPVRGQLFRKAKVKSLRMTALIVAAFIVCWTPYWVLFMVVTFVRVDSVNPRAVLWIFFFGMANSMVNPMIYGAFHVCKTKRPSAGSIPIPFRKPAQPPSKHRDLAAAGVNNGRHRHVCDHHPGHDKRMACQCRLRDLLISSHTSST